jgi:NitT/TauT family transport system ATP-binding protein
MLEIRDLTRVYGRGDAAHVAVEGVEFQVAEGELVSIVGPSGCGKSTVLRCIAGLLAPTSGQRGPAAAPDPAEPAPTQADGGGILGRGRPDRRLGPLYPWQLSGGMQQRVALARALACDPVLLLMDEPFGSVDAQTREDLEDLVLRVRQERNITILLVTHDIDESVYVGDRVIVLTPGPGRVRAELTVNLPAPATRSSRKSCPNSSASAPPSAA